MNSDRSGEDDRSGRNNGGYGSHDNRDYAGRSSRSRVVEEIGELVVNLIEKTVHHRLHGGDQITADTLEVLTTEKIERSGRPLDLMFRTAMKIGADLTEKEFVMMALGNISVDPVLIQRLVLVLTILFYSRFFWKKEVVEIECVRRPNVAIGGKATLVNVNYFRVSLDKAPPKIFKYHFRVERSHDLGTTGSSEERPLLPYVVRNVINAAIRQCVGDFGGIRVVHDGISVMYASALLPLKDKIIVDLDARNNHLFKVTMQMTGVIATSLITDYYSNPDVNVVPIVEALDGDSTASNSSANPISVKGGKELHCGLHQQLRVGDHKLFLNVDQAVTIFYAPRELTDLVQTVLNVRSINDVRVLSGRDRENLSRTLCNIQVRPTHRVDRKRTISGISHESASQKLVNVLGENISVVEFFAKQFNVNLKYPQLPLVKVDSCQSCRKMLPIELCKVVPGQCCAKLNDFDIAKLANNAPNNRTAYILDQICRTGFENDPYLAAFGIKVEQRLETAEARMLDPPDILFANVVERPRRGQWNLRSKRFLEGATLRNWGVVVLANNIGERTVVDFIRNVVAVAGRCGMNMENDPLIIYKERFAGVQVVELLKMSHDRMNTLSKSSPQFILVIKQGMDIGLDDDIKRTSDTVLGILTQCILANRIHYATPQYWFNVCMQINAKLGGRNSVLLEELPLLSSEPTIIIGTDAKHPRPGMNSTTSIAAVVASIDWNAVKFIARVAPQESSSDIPLLSSMLRDLFLTYYENNNLWPKHVIYYRDGVTEDQYHTILQTEMQALCETFKTIADDYKPSVTFIIVN
ncbi:LOW QUALITY PROTEIN: Argonaute3, partial [Phytophthora megakarya]